MRRWWAGMMRVIQSANRGVLILSYIVIIAVCFIAVICRYIFNDSLTWAEELARYIFIAMVFLGSAYVILDDGHLRMDVLYTSVPRGVRRVIDAITAACAFFFLGTCLTATWAGLGIVGSQRWSTLPLPMLLAYLPMFIGIALGLLYLLQVAMYGKTTPESSDGAEAGSSEDRER